MGDIFIACKRGDLPRVKELVQEMACQINVTDKWNSTPLYYACLSGYESIVMYLLQSGAQYDLDRFSGERCMNGALTDEIRNMLRNPPPLKSFTRNIYRESMSCMLREAYDLYSDICLVIGNTEHLYAHKIVLSQRTTYFAHSLQGPNRGKYLFYFRHPKETSVDAWTQVLNYVYTQELCIDKKADPTLYKDCLHLSRRLGIQDLTALLRSQPVMSQLYKKDVSVVQAATDCRYFPELAEHALSDYTEHGQKQKQTFADLCFILQNHRFYCHKAFIVTHSAYFKALLGTNQFSEVRKSNRGKLTFITLTNIDAYSFSVILKFIYNNSTELSAETLHDILYYSDHYMIHGLKLACGDVLATLLNLHNIIQTLALARMLRMSKLQHACLRFIAYNFDQVCDTAEFIRLLKHDEKFLRGRRRFSESSLEEEEDLDMVEEEEEEEEIQIDEGQCVDMQVDLRLYLREITNSQQHSHTAQLREEKCASLIGKILAEKKT